MCPSSLPYSKRMERYKPSTTSGIMQYALSPGVISFAGGWPDPGLFPAEKLVDVSEHVLMNMTKDALQYGTTKGLPLLVDVVVDLMAEQGCKIGPENVAITSGSMQGIDMINRLFLDEGDLIMVESPTFLGALGSFKGYGVRFAPIPLDENGARVDLVEKMIDEEKPKFLYLLPTFQNPMGVSMSLERRKQIIEIAAAKDVILLEDNPYGSLRFAGEPMPTLLELDMARNPETNAESYQEGNVIYLGSFSKVLAPGLRVAWTVAKPEIIQKILAVKMGNDLHTSALAQAVCYEFAHQGLLPDNIERIRTAYRERRDVMYAAIEKYFPEGVEYTKPEGGLFLWMTLPEGIDAMALFESARKFDVAFFPGEAFFVDGSGKNTLRLSFAAVLPDEIDEGMRRLGDALKAML